VAVIDLDALDVSIAEGEKKNFFVAPIVKELIAELREARKARHITNEQLAQAWDESRDSERAAVVAWLRSNREASPRPKTCWEADAIERGEHRREEEP
jgi:hypothetical protein